jgi:hypothetical protein
MSLESRLDGGEERSSYEITFGEHGKLTYERQRWEVGVKDKTMHTLHIVQTMKYYRTVA